MTTLKRPAAPGARVARKVYVRSTRGGQAQKIVRELYLRDDIPCASRLCTRCHAPTDASGDARPFVLSDRPPPTETYPRGHYTVPDTNAFLTAMDLFEHAPALADLVVLQTVLEELRHRSPPLYHRLVALTRSAHKRCYVFFNDFHLDTYVPRAEAETINDRNDRAIRAAVKWYAQHLGQSVGPASPDVVMLSNDRDNRAKAREGGLKAVSVHDYVSGLEDAARLLDMIGDAPSQEAPATTDLVYPEYLTPSRIQTGIRAGTLHQGPFSVSTYNFLEGAVSVAAFDKPLLVLGRANINRAVHGDVVVVEILPRDQWKTPSARIVEQDSLNRDEPADDGDGSQPVVSASERRALHEDVKRAHSATQVRPTARITGIIRRNWRPYVGHLDPTTLPSVSSSTRTPQTVFLLPMDRRIPKIRLRTRQAHTLRHARIVAAIDRWDAPARHPAGHIVRALGPLETQEAETEALLLEHDVASRPFPRGVLDGLPRQGHAWRVPADTTHPAWRARRDLRHLAAVASIDPPGCEDIDDALHARPLPNGNLEVGVHIADVAHFVAPGTPMDREAADRGTSVYLVDKRIDMLPPLLGTDLCSLRPGVDRFAVSVVWEMTADAQVVGTTFTKSAIRSRHACSYAQAQARIDDPALRDHVTLSMRTLLALARRLRAHRMAAGALNLASPEVKVQMDAETSDPLDGVDPPVDPRDAETSDPLDAPQAKPTFETNSLVEEFMLLANVSVARRIHATFPHTALLRRHAAPPPARFDDLADQLRVVKGLALDPSSSRALADSLDTCSDPSDPFFNTLVRILATRCMMSAEYFPAGTHPEAEFRHYGLASSIYTHFTSPIRRYADLVVHRQLAACIATSAVAEVPAASISGGASIAGGAEVRAVASISGVAPSAAGTSTTTTTTLSAPAPTAPSTPPAPSLRELESLCRTINHRHRNAQMAGRASIEYYVGQALKGRVVPGEPAHVMRVFSNGFVVYVPRFGIEGVIRTKDLGDATFDADTYTLRMDGLEVKLFQQVRVRIRDVKEQATGKRKVQFELDR